MNPYKETPIGENEYIREFSHELSSDDLEWHLDKEDRIISPVDPTDWLIQLDNELPKIIKGDIFIKKETYHRLIKGTKNLKLKLIKIYL